MKRILRYNFQALNTFYLLNFVTKGKLQQPMETTGVAKDLQGVLKQGSSRLWEKGLGFQPSKSKI